VDECEPLQRGRSARKSVAVLRATLAEEASAADARGREEEAAAITVQSVHRGRVARRSIVDRKAGCCTSCSSGLGFRVRVYPKTLA